MDDRLEQHSGFTLRDILHIVFKRKWVILFFFIATASTVGAVARLMDQSLYESSAQILLRAGREHIADLSLSSGGSLRPQIAFNVDDQAVRTIAMLTGRYLAEQLVRKVGVQALCRPPAHARLTFWEKPYCDTTIDERLLFERVVAQVRENISAERVGDAALVNFSFKHTNPETAALVVNTLGALYVERYLGVQRDPKTEQFFDKQFSVREARLKDAEAELARLKSSFGVAGSVKDELDLASRALIEIQSSYRDSVSKAAELRSRLTELRAQLDKTVSNPQTVLSLRNRLVYLLRSEEDRNLDAAARQKLNEEIRTTRDRLFQLEENKSKDGELYETVKSEMLRTEADLRAQEARVAVQGPKVAELQRKVASLGHAQPELDRAQQRFEMERDSYKLYATKSEESRISDAMDAEHIASVNVVEPARVPLVPLNNKTGLKMAIGVVFGLFGALVLAFALELFSDRLETSERAENVLGVPVLASLPTMRRLAEPANAGLLGYDRTN